MLTFLLPELHPLLERAREFHVAVATSPSYYTNPKAGPTTAAEVGFQDGGTGLFVS